jgi:quinol monooxygenase YgiN
MAMSEGWTVYGNRCTPPSMAKMALGQTLTGGRYRKGAKGYTMKPLTIIAKLKAKNGCEEQLGQVLRSLIEPTRAEKGCINYDLHRSHEDPGLFIFYENWESRSLWEEHMKSPHLMDFSEKQGALTESWELFVGEKV